MADRISVYKQLALELTQSGHLEHVTWTLSEFEADKGRYGGGPVCRGVIPMAPEPWDDEDLLNAMFVALCGAYESLGVQRPW